MSKEKKGGKGTVGKRRPKQEKSSDHVKLRIQNALQHLDALQAELLDLHKAVTSDEVVDGCLQGYSNGNVDNGATPVRDLVVSTEEFCNCLDQGLRVDRYRRAYKKFGQYTVPEIKADARQHGNP